MRYDSGGIPGGIAADFSNEAGIIIDLVQFDLGNVTDMPITITLSDGSNTAALMHLLTSPGAQSVLFNLNDFAGIGSVALNSIDSIEIFFDGQLAQDFRLDQISTISSLIPEPTSVAVWSVMAVAGGGVALRRRRRV